MIRASKLQKNHPAATLPHIRKTYPKIIVARCGYTRLTIMERRSCQLAGGPTGNVSPSTADRWQVPNTWHLVPIPQPKHMGLWLPQKYLIIWPGRLW